MSGREESIGIHNRKKRLDPGIIPGFILLLFHRKFNQGKGAEIRKWRKQIREIFLERLEPVSGGLQRNLPFSDFYELQQGQRSVLSEFITCISRPGSPRAVCLE